MRSSWRGKSTTMPFHLYLNKPIDQARPHRTEDPHHAGLSRLLPGAGRAPSCRPRRARSTRRSSAAWSMATAGRSPASSISAGREDQVPRRSRLLHRRGLRAGQQEHLGQADRRAEEGAAQGSAQGEADAVAEFAAENAKDTKRQADAGIQTIKFDGAAGASYYAKAYRGRLGGRDPAKPGARAEAEGAVLEAQITAAVIIEGKRRTWKRCLARFGRLLEALLFAAGLLLLVMTLMIVGDVFLRNIGAGGIPPSNEFSEDASISSRC